MQAGLREGGYDVGRNVAIAAERSDRIARANRPSTEAPISAYALPSKGNAVLAQTASMQQRTAMYNANAFKIGIVRRQLLVRPLGHQGAGALVGELAGLPQARAHGGPGRHRFHAADRPLEGLRRRHRLSRLDARDRDLGRRPARRNRAHHRVRHRARAAVQSDHRGQGVRHRRPHRRRTLRHQPGGRLERGRVRDVRRQPARARRAL